MPNVLIRLCARCWRYCAGWLREACSAAPARRTSRRRRSSLEFALRPLPGATACRAIHALLVLVYSFELFAQRNELWAALLFIAAIVVAVVIWNGYRHTKYGA